MRSKDLVGMVEEALDELKAVDIQTLEVGKMTSITDFMVIAGGTSDRHVRAVADNVIAKAKEANVEILGVEGHEFGEWILVDLADVVVHIMQAKTRDFYKLENLWSMSAPINKSNDVPDAGTAH